MHTDIFSFLQAQVNSQSQQLLPGISPQENSGAIPGKFDALIAEYTLAENSDSNQQTISAQNNSAESSRPVNFSDSTKFSGIITEFSQPGNESPESNPNVTENKSAWLNLFADVKRSPIITPKSHENFLPQNDFDDGVTIASSEIDDADFDSHGLPVKDNTDDIPEIQQEAQKIKPEISQTEHERDNNQADIQTEKDPTNYNENIAGNLKQSAEIDKPGIKPKVPEKKENLIPEPSAEKTEPEIMPDINSENVRRSQNIPEHEGREISSPSSQNESPEILQPLLTEKDSPENESSAQNVKPEITEPSKNENVTEIRKPSAEIETPENIRHLPTENDTPENESSADNVKPGILQPSRNENVTESQPSAENAADESETETPDKIPEPQNIPRKSPVMPGLKPDEPERTESRENHGTIQNDITPEKSPAKFQDIHAETDAPEIDSSAETETPEIESPYQDSNTQSESESPEISEPLKRESPKISKETETPEKQPEISEPNIIMAGLQAAPSAQNSPEISQAPETDNTPKNLRAPGNSPRKSQPVTQETENAISFADSENPASDSRIVTPTQSRTTQNQPGHEETNDSESIQPSESHGIAEAPRVRITNQPERISRTTQRTESRNDTRRTEALNDFQTFFDSVNRVRRSPARVSAQPLSLRTGTYDSDGIQSRPTALRNSIVNTVRFIRSDGVRKANIIIDPPALGRISVELTSSSSGVEASVKVANEQIRQIVQDQFTQLRDNLLQQGVQVSEFTVDVQQDSGRQGNGSGSQNQREDYTFTPSEDDDDTEIFRADLEEGLLYWIA